MQQKMKHTSQNAEVRTDVSLHKEDAVYDIHMLCQRTWVPVPAPALDSQLPTNADSRDNGGEQIIGFL